MVGTSKTLMLYRGFKVAIEKSPIAFVEKSTGQNLETALRTKSGLGI
jgi:hypothetical protein